MDMLVPENLVTLLLISTTMSIFIMAFLQKLKQSRIIKKNHHLWIMNFLVSLSIGIPFGLYFYNLNIYDSVWAAFFSFLGAPTIYAMLKKQNIINYKPKTIGECTTEDAIHVPVSNVIKRGV